MRHRSDSLNSQIFDFDAYAGDFVPRPVAPEDLPHLLKIRKMYVEAGLMPELKEKSADDGCERAIIVIADPSKENHHA
jgi:hypothetical protein